MCPSCHERIQIPRPVKEPEERPPAVAELLQPESPKSQALVPLKKSEKEKPQEIIPVVLPAAQEPPPMQYGWVTLKVSAQLLNWPPVCCLCMGPEQYSLEASYTRQISGGRLQTNVWRIPYCHGCAGQVQSGQIGAAVEYIGRHATVHTFRFWNQTYALAFAQANASKMLRS